MNIIKYKKHKLLEEVNGKRKCELEKPNFSPRRVAWKDGDERETWPYIGLMDLTGHGAQSDQ